jgi:hypothetical protein
MSEGVDGVLVRVANVDRKRVVGVHEGHQPVHQVRNVLERPAQAQEVGTVSPTHKNKCRSRSYSWGTCVVIFLC